MKTKTKIKHLTKRHWWRPTLQMCSPLAFTTVSQTSTRCDLNQRFKQLTARAYTGS